MASLRRLARLCRNLAKQHVDDPDVPAAPDGAAGYAEWVQIALILFRVELEKSLRETEDYLNEMPHVLGDWNYAETIVDVRHPLSLPERLTPEQIEQLDRRYRKHDIEFDTKHMGADANANIDAEITEKDQEVLDWIPEYILENDQAPTATRAHKEGPASTNNARQLLESLADKGVLHREDVTRGGNDTVAYHPNRLCSFARRSRRDCVIAVESKKTEYCDFGISSPHACYGGEG